MAGIGTAMLRNLRLRRQLAPPIFLCAIGLVIVSALAAFQSTRKPLGPWRLYRSPCAGGLGLHVNRPIWNSLVCLSREEPRVRAANIEYSTLASPGTLGGTTCIFQVRVPDADDAFERAVRAGAAPSLPPGGMFWARLNTLVERK